MPLYSNASLNPIRRPFYAILFLNECLLLIAFSSSTFCLLNKSMFNCNYSLVCIVYMVYFNRGVLLSSDLSIGRIVQKLI